MHAIIWYEIFNGRYPEFISDYNRLCDIIDDVGRKALEIEP